MQRSFVKALTGFNAGTWWDEFKGILCALNVGEVGTKKNSQTPYETYMVSSLYSTHALQTNRNVVNT